MPLLVERRRAARVSDRGRFGHMAKGVDFHSELVAQTRVLRVAFIVRGEVLALVGVKHGIAIREQRLYEVHTIGVLGHTVWM